MITFLTTAKNAHPMRWFLATYGTRLREVVVPRSYEDLISISAPPVGTYVFADVEILTDEMRGQVADLYERLEKRGCRLLNHPTRTMRRAELLRTLHARGVNDFDVHLPGETIPAHRFPVFVRRANDHEGNRTPLLSTPEALAAALASLEGAGEKLEDSLVVESCDTADGQGLYRKFGAFVVGDRVLARHLFFSRDWMIKDHDLLERKHLREEREYVASNPHAKELREIFATARVEYGRIDYALKDGRIQVWEINSNPVIAGTGHGGPLVRAFTRFPSGLRRMAAPIMSTALKRARVHAAFADAMESALRALDGRTEPGTFASTR